MYLFCSYKSTESELKFTGGCRWVWGIFTELGSAIDLNHSATCFFSSSWYFEKIDQKLKWQSSLVWPTHSRNSGCDTGINRKYLHCMSRILRVRLHTRAHCFLCHPLHVDPHTLQSCKLQCLLLVTCLGTEGFLQLGLIIETQWLSLVNNWQGLFDYWTCLFSSMQYIKSPISPEIIT